MTTCWPRPHKPPSQYPQATPSASELQPWGGEDTGSFRFKVRLQWIHTEEVKLQDVSLTDSSKGSVQRVAGRATDPPRPQRAGDGQQDSRHRWPLRCLGQRSSSFLRLSPERLLYLLIFFFVVVQSLSHVQLFATPWTTAHHASPSITNSLNLLKLMFIELVMSFNHLILCRPLLLLPLICPSIRVFSNESILCIRWPEYWSSPSASVLPMNIQGLFPLGWTGWILLLCKGLLRVFSNTTVQKA